MAQQFQELKEPLISNETKDKLTNEFLKSYVEKKYNFSTRGQQQNIEDKNENDATTAALNEDILENVQQQVSKSKRYEHPLIDFKAELGSLVENQFLSEPYQKDFYLNATANHELPNLTIEKLTLQKNNPNIFAVLSKASSLFQHIELKEYICFMDYKRFTRIRVRNYVNLLRMLSKIDPSRETYTQIKTKLYQVKKLTEYLGLQYEALYKRLHKNQQIHDIPKEEQESDKEEEDLEKEEEKSLKSKKSKSQNDEDEEKDQDEEEDKDKDEKSSNSSKSSKSAKDSNKDDDSSESNSEDDDDEEEEDNDSENDGEIDYLNFFKESNLTYDNDYYFTHELEREEKLWSSRAVWLDSILEDLKNKDSTRAWVPWFQAKLEELADLDVPLKNVEQQPSSQIFYLYDFIEQQISQLNHKSDYMPDQKVYPEQNNLYPTIKLDLTNINTSDYCNKHRFNIREKLCRRILSREQQTDYIITVFEKKIFGNEKIYERRINCRGKLIESINQFELHPNGGYLFIDFNIKESSSTAHQLIFTLNAQYKDPKMIKKGGTIIGFFEKFMYSLNLVKQKIVKDKKETAHDENKLKRQRKATLDDDMQINIEEEAKELHHHHDSPSKQPDEEGDEKQEEEDEYEEVHRVYEYDLTDFSKVKFYNIKGYGDEFSASEFNVGKFGKLKDGFYYKRTKFDNDYKFFNFEVFIRNDLYTMEASERFEAASQDYTRIVLNDKGDKAIISYWKDGVLTFMKYNFDPKDKKIKKDSDIKLKTEQLTLEKDKCDHNMYILGNDCVITIKITQVDKVFIYLNENQITSYKTELEEINFIQNDKGLQSIIIQKESDLEQIPQNLIKYVICEQAATDKEKKEWLWSRVQNEVYNLHYEVCFPYAFCIYNHDQVLMKDLTQRSVDGYYYMNNFLVIQPGTRPLTIYAITYNNKLAINVPVINSSYISNDFLIRVQQLKSFYQTSNGYKLHGMMRFKSYAYNQEILTILSTWSGVVDSQNKLHKEVKIQAKYNSLYIEQWSNNKCNHRLVISHFHHMNPRSETIKEDSDLGFRSQGQWVIIYQKSDGQSQCLQLFTHEMRGSFHQSDLMQLETVWDFDDDDQSSEIHGLYLDTLVRGKLSIYVMYSNCIIRKFTSNIPEKDSQVLLQFEESQHPYNLDYLFKVKNKESTGDKTASGKKVSLYEQQYLGDICIANSIFYSQKGIVDLNALCIENKFYTGIQITKSHLKEVEKILKLTYSYNEAKLASFYRTSDLCQLQTEEQKQWYGEIENQFKPKSFNGVMLLVCPLFNSRVIPQFDHRRFRHPVVPIVDQERACTSVFTLNLGPQWNEEYYFKFRSHSYYKKQMLNRLIDLNPGLIVKYFNGIEEEVPFHLFGEEFLDIIRFKQSLDGHYLTIVGTRIGKLDDRFYNQVEINKSKYHQGIFLYKLEVNSVTLVKSFLFAVKNIEADKEMENSLKQKLTNKSKQERVELEEPEINGPLVGEYDTDLLENDGLQDSIDWDETIEFNKYDDQLVIQKRAKMGMELREKKKLEESLKKKNRRSTNIRHSISSPDNRASIRENLLNTSVDHEENDQENAHRINNDLPQLLQSTTIEGDIEKEIEAILDKELPHAITLKYLSELFKGLDIPYLQNPNSTFEAALRNRLSRTVVLEQERKDEINPEVVEAFDFEEDKLNLNTFSEEEANKIDKIHFNMLLDVNEHGLVFLTNRLNNTLYFFYECHGEHKLAKFKFEENFVITQADASHEYLVITAKEQIAEGKIAERYRVLNIKPVLECEDHNQIFDISKLQVLYDSKTHETLNVKPDVVGADQYTYQIEECRVVKHNLILQIMDSNQTRYLRVFDMRDKIMTYYLENQNYMISGCKKFVWIRDDNVVYDLENGLSTFFMWPGDQINTHSYDAMDGFNVTEDRTLMTTQGYVHLAFNLLSLDIDDEFYQNPDFQSSTSRFSKSNNFSYMCYKIGDYKSVLEKLFIEDYDKKSKKEFKQQSDEDEREEMQAMNNLNEDEKKNQLQNHQITQNKQISNLLQFLSEKFSYETLDQSQLTNFFFSYYFIDKQDIRGGSSKHPKLLNIFEKMYSLTLDKRVDLIEDILHYVVECKTIPITQTVINSCFKEFLKNANTSQAFQSYLNNITVQTIRMHDIEKFQVTSNDLGFIADSYNSPVMDDGFYSKFKQPKETKKDVEISYINLGKLLSEQGEEIMDMLSDKKYLSIMDIPFIKYLVMYQWLQVKHTIHKKLLYPFFVMLGMFTVYCMIIDFKDVPLEQEWYQQMFRWLFAVILFPVLGYFFYVEVIQFIKDPSDYFKSFWNFSDLFSYTLCLLVILFDRIPQVPSSVNRPVASVCLIILWIKLFYFLRVFESTARLIRMIIEIVNDMKNFLMVLTIGILGFSGGFYILQQGEQNLEDKPSVFMSVIYTYRLAQGDFQLDNFEQLNTTDFILAWLLFVIGSLFLVIVLLNLLIAIMGDTFSRVLENVTNLSVREKVMLVSENESLFDRANLFQSAQFLIIINEKNLDSVQADNWDGQINAFKRQMLEKVTNLQSDLDSKMTENQKDLKKRINDQDEKAKKQGTASEQRIQSVVKMEFSEAVNKINDQFLSQQTVLKMQQVMAAEQMKTMRTLQEQMEQIRSDQIKISQIVQKAFAGDGKKPNQDEDDE